MIYFRAIYYEKRYSEKKKKKIPQRFVRMAYSLDVEFFWQVASENFWRISQKPVDFFIEKTSIETAQNSSSKTKWRERFIHCIRSPSATLPLYHWRLSTAVSANLWSDYG